jgi:hypothetical protein
MKKKKIFSETILKFMKEHENHFPYLTMIVGMKFPCEICNNDVDKVRLVKLKDELYHFECDECFERVKNGKI